MTTAQLVDLLRQRYPSGDIPRGSASAIQRDTGASWTTIRKAFVEVHRTLDSQSLESLRQQVSVLAARCAALESELASADARADQRFSSDRAFLMRQLAESKRDHLHSHIQQPAREEEIFDRSR